MYRSCHVEEHQHAPQTQNTVLSSAQTERPRLVAAIAVAIVFDEPQVLALVVESFAAAGGHRPETDAAGIDLPVVVVDAGFDSGR